MPEWRVVIADDEPAARRGVRHLLAPFPDFTIVSECRDGLETVEAMRSRQPHLVFLDVQMPELDGFGVMSRQPAASRPVIVLLTAYDQFALRGFEAEALDYLVKPVSEARFHTTMERVRRRLSGGQADAREATLVVTSQAGSTIVPVIEIDWIEAAGNYARLWTGGKSHLLREPLADLEPRLAGHGFLRAHRNALIRMPAVRALRTSRAGGVVALLASGASVPVSRRRRAAFARVLRALSPDPTNS